MDIEGAEYNALLGTINTIKRDKPKLAICIYHTVEVDIRILLLIYFRHHGIISDESVLYSVAN